MWLWLSKYKIHNIYFVWKQPIHIYSNHPICPSCKFSQGIILCISMNSVLVNHFIRDENISGLINIVYWRKRMNAEMHAMSQKDIRMMQSKLDVKKNKGCCFLLTGLCCEMQIYPKLIVYWVYHFIRRYWRWLCQIHLIIYIKLLTLFVDIEYWCWQKIFYSIFVAQKWV